MRYRVVPAEGDGSGEPPRIGSHPPATLPRPLAGVSMNPTPGPSPADLAALDDRSFRRVVRDWIEANCPAHLRHPPKRLHWPDTREWYLKLSAHGWLAPGWPREHGGMGLSASKQLIMIEEHER